MRMRTLRRSPRSSTSGELNLDLHPKQWMAFESQATEILYGGAAGFLGSIHQHGRLADIGTIFNLPHEKVGDVCP